jgi:REP element-mobilizing transposase RayT
MNADGPFAFFITWTVYGSFLQGDERGWRRRRNGTQQPQSRLASWRRERLKHPILTLSIEQRGIVERECQRHCNHRGWKVWEVNARTNHVHAVVTAVECSGKTVRDQLKANCTRALRENYSAFSDRPVWTTGGDWECINYEDDLVTVCEYVRDAQDRMQHKGG